MKKNGLKIKVFIVSLLTLVFLSSNFIMPEGTISKTGYNGKNVAYASPKSFGGFKSGGFKSGGFKSGGFKSGIFKSSGKSSGSSTSGGFGSGIFSNFKKKSTTVPGSNGSYSAGTRRSFLPIPIPIPWGHSFGYGGFAAFGIFSILKFIFNVILIIIIIIIILRIIRRRR